MLWSKEIIARNIRRYMTGAGINQKELAEIIGVSAPTVNDWLKAKKYPRIDRIELMANYFGCEKSDLIEDKEKEPTATNGDELTPVKREALDLISQMSDEDLERFIRIARAVLGD